MSVRVGNVSFFVGVFRDGGVGAIGIVGVVLVF